MTKTISYVVVDIETDGPIPGLNSILNLSAVAADRAGVEIDSLSLNLSPLADTAPDPGTLEWWQSCHPDVWKQITTDPVSPAEGMKVFARFVRALDARCSFVGHPLAFDGHWVGYYMERILGQGLMPFPGTTDPLFFGAGIDLPSFVAGALNIDISRCRHGHYPPEVASMLPHTHHGLDDARGHADVLHKTLRYLEERA